MYISQYRFEVEMFILYSNIYYTHQNDLCKYPSLMYKVIYKICKNFVTRRRNSCAEYTVFVSAGANDKGPQWPQILEKLFLSGQAKPLFPKSDTHLPTAFQEWKQTVITGNKTHLW